MCYATLPFLIAFFVAVCVFCAAFTHYKTKIKNLALSLCSGVVDVVVLENFQPHNPIFPPSAT